MRLNWKNIVAAFAVALIVSPVAGADPMPRSEWHNLVGECTQNTKALRETMAKISPEDQALFLAEVNGAIAKMPGSDEVKAATFYAANSAAVKSAAKNNLAVVLAEVFATVPPEFLTDINERFAKEIFSRDLVQSRKISDEEYLAVATNAMAVISARCEKAENPGVRETFAVCMFVRASGGSPANLKDVLIAGLPTASTRETAANEWINPALGIGQEQSYDAMLGSAGAGEEPDHAAVLTLTGANDEMVALLGDLAAENSSMQKSASNLGANADTAAIAGTPLDRSGMGLNRVPRAYAQSETAVGGNSEGSYASQGEDNPYYSKHRGTTSGSSGSVEPKPYPGQNY